MDDPPGLDGPPAAGHRGRDRPARTRWHASRSSMSPDAQGELALRPGWPSMFRGYLARGGALPQVLRRRLVPHRRPRPARRRRLLLVRRPRRRRDQVGRPPHRPVRGRERADGAPRGRRGRRDRQARSGDRRDREGVRLRSSPATQPSEALRRELLGFARKRLGPAVAPKEIDFRDELPKTRSGKIMRRLLKARELGLARGRSVHARRKRVR